MRFRASLAALVLVPLLAPLVSCSGEAAAAQTELHLEMVAWDLPAGIRIRATSRAQLRVMTRSPPKQGADGRPLSPEVENNYDGFAAQTLEWDHVTTGQPRESTRGSFVFPISLAGLDTTKGSAAGQVLVTEFEIAVPAQGAGQWKVARASTVELGLFLDGEQLRNPTACLRFTREADGYAAGIAYECTEESFRAVLAGSTTTCPTCVAGAKTP